MDFLTETVYSSFKEFSKFYEELSDISHASNVSLPDLNLEINNLKSGFQELTETLEKYQKLKSENETLSEEDKLDFQSDLEQPYINFLSSFVTLKKDSLEDLLRYYEEMLQVFPQTLTFYALDSKTTPNQFFQMIQKFSDNFKRSFQKVISEKETPLPPVKRLGNIISPRKNLNK